MLPKKNRLSRLEIEQLKKKGKTYSSCLFSLLFQKGNQFKTGLIVSHKLLPKATQRNKIKRIFYQIIQDLFPVKKGYFLFLIKKSFLNATKEEIKKEIKEILEKI